MASKEHTEQAKWTAAYVGMGGALFGPAGVIIAGLSAVIGNALLGDEDDAVESEQERWERISAWLERDDARWKAYFEEMERWRRTHDGPRPQPPTAEDSWHDRWRRHAYRAARAKRWARAAWDQTTDSWAGFWAWYWDNYDKGVDAAERDRENGERFWWWQPRPGTTDEPVRTDDEPQDAEWWDIPRRDPVTETEPGPRAVPGGGPGPRLGPGGGGGGGGGGPRPAPPGPPPAPRPSRRIRPLQVPSTTAQPIDQGDNDMTHTKALTPRGSGRGLSPSAQGLQRRRSTAVAGTGITGAEIQGMALDVFARKHQELIEMINHASQLARTLTEGAAATLDAANGNAATTETRKLNDVLVKVYNEIDNLLVQVSTDCGAAERTIRAAIGANMWEQAMQESVDASGADARYWSRQTTIAGA